MFLRLSLQHVELEKERKRGGGRGWLADTAWYARQPSPVAIGVRRV
jgi:hypothetical protein